MTSRSTFVEYSVPSLPAAVILTPSSIFVSGVSLTSIPKLLDALTKGFDIAIGSRWLRAEMQTQRQPLHRQLFGRIFNLLLRITLGLQYKDTQCGFKAFTQQAAQGIFPLQKIERWGFDPEILFLARKFGFKVREVPVAWGHSGDTRIHPLLDGSRMFMEMLRIRWYDLTHRPVSLCGL